MDKIEGDNIPGNYHGNEINLNNGGWILIAILIFLIVLVTLIAIYIHLKSSKKIEKLKEFNSTPLSEEERELLTKYRSLNSTDKTVIKDTLNTLSNNHKNTTTE